MKRKAIPSDKYDPIRRLNQVDNNVQIPADIELAIRRLLEHEEIEKGEFLLEAKDVCDRIWFIKKGLFRSYRMVKGQVENTWFMRENDLMTDPKSFHTGEPSKHYIQAEEHSIVCSISRQQIHTFCNNSHAFEHICHLLTWEYYTKFMDYWDELTSGTTKQRYSRYLMHFPGLDGRISVAHIASLLKCDPRSIYRAKGKRM